jgi:hypothetical protein
MKLHVKAVLGALALLTVPPSVAHAQGPLFRDDFSSYWRDSIIASEHAYQNGQSWSPWTATSGCLLEREGMSATGWTGDPLGRRGYADPNCRPTGSAVFRVVTNRADFKDEAVTMRLFLRTNESTTSPFVATDATPATIWDGVKIFLRYQNSTHLYYAAVARRDGRVVIKKKCPGGTEAGGTYYDIGPEIDGHWLNPNVWHDVAASAVNTSNGVRLTLSQHGRTLVTVTDTGVGCEPIWWAGRVGIRADNVNAQFDDFTVNKPL